MPAIRQRPGFARADHPLIAASLEAMRQLVVARGGYVHPAAAIEAYEGALRVVCHAPGASGKPLFTVPAGLLVPVDDLAWCDSNAAFELDRVPSHLSADQADLLGMFIAIYSASNKLAWVQQQAPIVLSRDAELAAQVDLIRPFQPSAAPTAAATFLETRFYRVPRLPAGLAGKNVIMPLIDFANSHLGGSAYHGADGSLQINVTDPAGSGECFINYSDHRDPLALALGHGYLDANSPYAYSVPLTLDLAGFGCLTVRGVRTSTKHKSNPPKAEFCDDGLCLSHIAGNVSAPHHLHGALRLAITASARRRGISDAVTERTLAELPAAILAENRKKLAAFRTYLTTRPELPLAALLAEASHMQIANLEKVLQA